MKRTGFDTSEEVSRWSGLYGQERDSTGKSQRWAIFQKYAQKRALDRLKMCTSLISDYRGKRVLDIACGTGQYGSNILKKGGKWVGLEFSLNMLAQARKNLAGNKNRASLVNADITQLPFTVESFDIVFCIGILSYFDSKAAGKILRDLPTLLVPGGKLVLQNIRMDIITWVRSRLPSKVPRPIRLPGPLFPKSVDTILGRIDNSLLRIVKVIHVKKFIFIPFQTIYFFEKTCSD